MKKLKFNGFITHASKEKQRKLFQIIEYMRVNHRLKINSYYKKEEDRLSENSVRSTRAHNITYLTDEGYAAVTKVIHDMLLKKLSNKDDTTVDIHDPFFKHIVYPFYKDQFSEVVSYDEEVTTSENKAIPFSLPASPIVEDKSTRSLFEQYANGSELQLKLLIENLSDGVCVYRYSKNLDKNKNPLETVSLAKGYIEVDPMPEGKHLNFTLQYQPKQSGEQNVLGRVYIMDDNICYVGVGVNNTSAFLLIHNKDYEQRRKGALIIRRIGMEYFAARALVVLKGGNDTHDGKVGEMLAEDAVKDYGVSIDEIKMLLNTAKNDGQSPLFMPLD